MSAKFNCQKTGKPEEEVMSKIQLPENWKTLVGLTESVVLQEADLNAVDAMVVVAKLTAALKKISNIKDKMSGGDWDEIEQARDIAKKALAIPELKKQIE